MKFTVLALAIALSGCRTTKHNDQSSEDNSYGSKHRSMFLDMECVEEFSLGAGLDVGEKPKCACSKTTIKCGAQLPKNVEGKCNSTTCVLFMTQASCDSLGLKSGDVVDTQQTLDKPFSPPTPGTTHTFNEITNQCMLNHELTHACDGPTKTQCETEGAAFKSDLACYKAFYDMYCNPEPVGAAELQLCRDIQVRVIWSQMAIDFFKCRCDGKTTSACVIECKRAYPDSPRACDQIGEGYKEKVNL
jgi:hypothetical protein